MLERNQDYVVVTRYRKTQNHRPIVHVYGPYNRNKAKSVRSNMLAEEQRLGAGGDMEINVCHIIDIDQMNREKAAETVRDTILK